MDTTSQNKAVLAHLKSGKTITQLQALDLYGCMRLGGRAYDIRNGIGVKKTAIKTTMIKVGNNKRVAQYSIANP